MFTFLAERQVNINKDIMVSEYIKNGGPLNRIWAAVMLA